MIVDFFNTAASLKSIPRQGWMSKLDMANPESVADHSYMTSLMSMVLSDIAELDTMRVVRMSLLHDMAESKTGDLIPEEISKSEKEDLENSTMDGIILDLPETIRDGYREAWNEFQSCATEEAKFVHEVDKLEMALQAKIYSKDTSPEKIRAFFESAKSSIHDKHLQNILEQILSE